MKIGIISRGRTHSSAIIASLAHQYNLKNFNEKYFEVFSTINTILTLQSKFKKDNVRSFEIYKRRIISETNNIFLNNNFIIKLWPSMLTFLQINVHEYEKKLVFEKIKENIIFNITDYWKIKNYDKLYFLDRNLTTSLYSWLYSKKTKKWQKTKNEIFNAPIITLANNDFVFAKEYILEYCLQQKIKDYLNKNNLEYTYICDDYNLYINNNIVRFCATDNNYKSLIKNTEELDKLLQEWYPICLEYSNDWQFY